MRVPFHASTLNRATIFGVSRLLRHFPCGCPNSITGRGTKTVFEGAHEERPYLADHAVNEIARNLAAGRFQTCSPLG